MFSVVIPAYNCESTIERVLDSVKGQSRIDLIDEIIIINDGSNDRTGAVIQKYQKKNSELPIVYISQENQGVSKTRNRGILRASSPWVALLDSDDIWLEHKLERQYNIVTEEPDIKFLGASAPSGFFRFKTGLVKLTAKELCITSIPSTPSVIFHRETGIKLGLFDENMHFSEDINFFQKFLTLDSYFILFEQLVDINLDKNFHGEHGLSSNFDKMAKGRNENIQELYNMGLISKSFMVLILGFNSLKLLRRKCLTVINKKFK